MQVCDECGKPIPLEEIGSAVPTGNKDPILPDTAYLHRKCYEALLEYKPKELSRWQRYLLGMDYQ